MTGRAVKLNWLKNQPTKPVGMTWGIPWKEGELLRDESLILKLEDGSEELPLQSWPTAYWPDGSVKWSAHAATTAAGSAADRYFVVKGERKAAAKGLSIAETEESITIDTGVISCSVARSGRQLIKSISRGGKELCSSGNLVCLKETVSQLSGQRTLREESFEGKLHRVIVEQSGPVRAVIKLEGSHRSVNRNEEWLPFVLRLYFYAGLDTIRMVHTFFYNGNPNEDFIKGLGIAFDVPLSGPLYNRHVRFAGDSGVFAESPKTLHTRRTKGKYRELFEAQLRGESVSFHEEDDRYFVGLLEDSAQWNDFKLAQTSSEHYRIQKRTQEGCCWIKSAEGARAGGVGYIGGENGGLAVGLRDFWRKHPAGLEVQGSAEASAKLTLWLWSPDGETMDMRHYDTKTHVESSYEGAEELRATPYGVANTSEIMLWCTARTPDAALIGAMVEELESPSRLMCEPEHLYETRAFGVWSLPDRSVPEKAYLEDQLDGIISFYQAEVEQRKWYGLWDYGDFMHSYDPARHVWNYDLGGCAWQNTELAANMWLWIMFLRSGREDIFRLAEAMTRHTSEVDVYHFGEYAGFGSRHNVVHWGCGCKEVRIAMAGLHRYYYYLTADERIGDIMDEVKDADYATVTLPPKRAYFPKDEHKTHVRIGPDWAAFSSNWMTRWERYEDTTYRDKIITGIDCIKDANFRLMSGPVYGYDPETSKLTPFGDDNSGRHLMICMGAPQVWMEMSAMLKDPVWDEMMADFGIFYNLPQEEKDQITGGAISHSRFEHPVLSTAIAAYGAHYYRNERTAREVWNILQSNDFAKVQLQESAARVMYMAPLNEIDWMNTNEAAQWSINTIISLELIAEWLPVKEKAGAVQ